MQKIFVRTIIFVMLIFSCLASPVYAGGYIPTPIDLSYLDNNPPVEEADDSPLPNDKDSSVPSTFDLRNVNGKNYVTSVKSQSPYGTCWAFASIGAMESNYLMQGGTNLDLSEMHLAWFAFRNSSKSKAFYNMNSASFSQVMEHGGNAFYTTALYSRLDGPVLESAVPYGRNAQPSQYTPESYTRVLRLRDVYYLSFNYISLNSSSSGREAVKKRIMESGAVMASYYNNDSDFQKTSSGGTSFYNKTSSTNHAILLVGWDDNYSKDNFKTKPNSNGAWLVKNSWGSQWYNGSSNVGDDGYFWMSYEQYLTGGTAFTVEAADNDLKAYYYDALGWSSSYGGSTNTNVYSANVFKAERDNEKLKEVGFYTTDNNQKYEIQIYTGLTSMPSSSPINGSPVATKSGTMPYAGYHTITLDDPVALTKNNYFSVVVIHKNTKMAPAEDNNSSMTTNAVIETGSFFSQNGTYWTTGATAKANACIKAFTVTGSSSSTGTAPTILTAYPTDGIINTAYSCTLSASGTSPITWSASGNVPSGLSLSSSGVLSGTPTSSGSYTFTVTASNTYGSNSKSYTMNILNLPSITPTSFTGYVKTSFNQTMTLSYGSSSSWSAENLPSGLSIKSSTGVISGKPKETGTFTAKISAVTSAGTSTASVTFTILPQPTKPKFETSSLADPVIGKSYSQAISITGTTPITVSVTGLPDGLSFNSSTYRISGTPTTEGNYTLKFSATNGATTSPVKKNIKLKVTAAPPVISVPSLAMGYVGVEYSSVQFSLSSGNGSITWSASGLPSGMSVSKTGLLSGTPKKGGNFTIKLTAKNSGGSDTEQIPLTVALLPEIKTSKLSDATTDKAYSAKLTATGSTPITWNITGLPSTLSVSTENDGAIAYITGTPTEAETYALSVTAANSVGSTTKSLSLKVKGVAPKITASFAKGTVGSSYTGTITTTGTKPMTFSCAIDANQQKKHGISSIEELGLTFTANSSTGTASITGTPTKSVKSLQITLTAANSVKTVTKKISLTISGTAPSFTAPNDNGNYTESINSSVSLNFTVTGTKDITFSMNKVAGFTLTQTGDYTATLTGTTPAKAKKLTFTITAKNSDGKATKKVIIQTTADTGSAPSVIIDDNSSYEPEIVNEQNISDGLNSEPVIYFGAERDLSESERENLNAEGYIIAEVLPELSVNESGMYEIEFELDENIPAGAKLFWFANSSEPSDDDEIAEFYDDTGAEIENVPENHIITASVWLNKGIIYKPVIAVK